MDNSADIFGAFLWSVIGFITGLVIGVIMTEEQRNHLWVKHAEDNCYPLAVDQTNPYLFEFRCAISENIRD